MPLTYHKATVYLALAKKNGMAGDPDVAIAFNNNSGDVSHTAVSDQRSDYDARSAIVNLIQSCNRRPATISCTSPPTARDLGMARMAGVQRINFLNSNAVVPQLGYYRRANRRMGTAWEAVRTDFLDASIAPIPEPVDFQPTTAAAWYNDNIGAPAPPHPLAPAHLNLVPGGNYGAAANTHFVRNTTNLTLPDFAYPEALDRDDPNPLRDRIFMQLAWAIVGETVGIRDNAGPYPTGHSIGSVLRGPADEILAWGLNTNHEHWTLHGEVNLLQSYQNTIVVDGNEIGQHDDNVHKPILYTTLEPCFMCAGMYLDSGQNLHCRYGQDDVGIVQNALANHVPPLEAELQTRLGRTAAIVLASHLAAGAALNIRTTELINDVLLRARVGVQALNEYFNIVPDAPNPPDAVPSPAFANWRNRTTIESYIWENGLKLLYHINNGVLAKWQARVDKHYPVEGFEV